MFFVFSQFPFPCNHLLLLNTSLVKISYAGGADLWAARSVSIAVTRKTTVYFIRSQMKWNRLRTSLQSHEFGLKFRAESCSPATINPFHPPLGAQPGKRCPGATGAVGAPAGAARQGSSHCPSQESGQAGLQWGPGEAGQGHQNPRVTQGLAAAPLVPPRSKTTCSQEGRGKAKLTFRGADSYIHSEPTSCRSLSQAAFESPTDFIVFNIVYFIIYPTDFTYSQDIEFQGACQRSTVGIREERLRTAWYLIIGCKYLLQTPLFATVAKHGKLLN